MLKLTDSVKFKPTQDYILIKPLERVASRVINVILLNELPNLGTVIVVGPGKRDKRGIVKPLDVQVGDIVRFGEFKNMFPEYYEGLTKYLIIQEADVAGVVELEDVEEALAA